MSFDIKKHIRAHSWAFICYSLIIVVMINYAAYTSPKGGYGTLFVMFFYACILGLHAIVALFDFIILSKNKEARLKGILVILAIGIIGLGLCWSPALIY